MRCSYLFIADFEVMSGLTELRLGPAKRCCRAKLFNF